MGKRKREPIVVRDGYGKDRVRAKAANTYVVLGPYRIPISREDYESWHRSVTATVGHDSAAIKREIKRRLGI